MLNGHYGETTKVWEEGSTAKNHLHRQEEGKLNS